MRCILFAVIAALLLSGMLDAQDLKVQKKMPPPAAKKDMTKLAYKASAVAHAYGSGGSVSADFLCATPEQARELVAYLKTLGGDKAPSAAPAPSTLPPAPSAPVKTKTGFGGRIRDFLKRLLGR